ncbi:MAG: hypothetical protein JWR75_969 [Devosia sp.]|nr:hypothetical protein [Devosia sp.]
MNRDEIALRIAHADWLLQPETQAVFALLDGAEGRTRVVGGVVRDTVLNLPRTSGEIDFATELPPEEVMQRARSAGVAAYPTGIEHGTVTLRLGPLVAEVTTLREDVTTDGRHAVVRFSADWYRDAARRDFTLNALYVDAAGELYDPLEGIEDCVARRVRFIGDADARIAEDRLRVFRFFRFSASHGNQTLDGESLAACLRARLMLGSLSRERVGSEMKRMLGLPKVAATLGVMADAVIVAIPAFALRALQAYERQAPRPDFHARLAFLTKFIEAERLKAEWRLSNDDIATALAIRDGAALLQALRIGEAAYRFGPVIDDAIEMAGVLEGWTSAGKQVVRDQVTEMGQPKFPLSGGDLVARGFKPGRGLGEELGRLETEWIDSGFELDQHSLLARLRSNG